MLIKLLTLHLILDEVIKVLDSDFTANRAFRDDFNTQGRTSIFNSMSKYGDDVDGYVDIEDFDMDAELGMLMDRGFDPKEAIDFLVDTPDLRFKLHPEVTEYLKHVRKNPTAYMDDLDEMVQDMSWGKSRKYDEGGYPPAHEFYIDQPTWKDGYTD